MAESSTFKSRLRRRLLRWPLRVVAKPTFDVLVAGELAALRALGRMPVAQAAEVHDVTAIIKTFERPRLLARLVRGLQLQLPKLRIIVADDSRRPSRLPGVRTLELPFDSGVAAGRQAALDAVQTKLTWVLDDDFIVWAGSRVDAVARLLQRHPELDIIGGLVVDLPLLRRRGSPLDPVYPTNARPRVPLGTTFGPVVVCDKVPNFFVGRTDRLRLVGWDSRLKRVEHADFFTRARGVLASGMWSGFSCLHAQTPFDASYMRRREDHDADAALLNERYFSPRA